MSTRCEESLNVVCYLFTDLLPDDPGHFITVQLDDGVLDDDFVSHASICKNAREGRKTAVESARETRRSRSEMIDKKNGTRVTAFPNSDGRNEIGPGGATWRRSKIQ